MLNLYMHFWRRYRLLVGVLAVGWLMIGVAIVWMQPRWLLRTLAPTICPKALYYVETDQPLVALTIDDGPDDQRTGKTNTTQKILDVLAQHEAKATFFLISSRITLQNQGLITEMVRQGHELGNHLMVDEPSIHLSLPKFEAALQIAEREILSAAQISKGRSLRWLRPGSGRCNLGMTQIAKQQGYRIALGSVWPYDTSLPSSAFAVQQILATVRPGSIIVLHDYGSDGDWGDRTALTLAQILPKLIQRGYAVVTLTELVQSATPSAK